MEVIIITEFSFFLSQAAQDEDELLAVLAAAL